MGSVTIPHFSKIVEIMAKKNTASKDAKEIEVDAAVEVKAEAKAEPKEKEVATAQVAPKAKGKLYEVKFLKNHEFSIGVVAYSKKRDEKMKVERHLANRFSQRGIATIVD
jgi:hypothetical protein